MFKEQALSFHVVSKTLRKITFAIPNNILLSCLVDFKTRGNRGEHNFEKQYYCGNYSDDVCQSFNTDQILLKIQYFDDSIL